MWFLIVIAVVLAGLASFLGLIAFYSRDSAIELSADGLRIRAAFYGRTIPLASLRPDAARSVDLSQQPDLQLGWRTNSIGLPGYGAGWFTLKSGEKALAFVSDSHRVAYIPTREGYAVLASVPDPQALVVALQQLTAKPTRS